MVIRKSKWWVMTVPCKVLSNFLYVGNVSEKNLDKESHFLGGEAWI